MMILCDVCNKDGASFFCAADDAALCASCDHRVHHVNKLAGKHQRFSLIAPASSPEQIPVCDICQEKRAFLFCQQDRAILCKDCDYSIHKVNQHTQNHNRFLLTGTKLSVDSTSVPDQFFTPQSTPTAAPPPPSSPNKGTSSSISEYLIETIPGWRVDDFLDPFAQSFDLSKEVEEDLVMPIWENEFGDNNLNSGIWVPQAPPSSLYSIISPPNMADVDGVSLSGSKSTARKWTADDGSFTVPQMSPQSPYQGSKRSRFAW